MTALSHTTARDYIQRVADGEPLRAEAREALRQHLAECVECRAYSEEITALHVMLSRTFRTRWEHQPTVSRPALRTARRPTLWRGPLMQVLAMLMVTVMVLSLWPQWSQLPTTRVLPASTETLSAPPVATRSTESTPDEGLERLANRDEGDQPTVTQTDEDRSESYPYFLNDPDNRETLAY